MLLEKVREKMINKKIYILAFMLFTSNTGAFVYSQNSTSIVPEAIYQIETLLNKPAMIYPAIVTALGRNWFRMETDFHVFTDQASFEQVASVMLDLDNLETIYNGKKSKMTVSIVNQTKNEALIDFVSISIGPLGIQFKTPYRANVKNTVNTSTKVVVELRQPQSDSSSNNDIKNLYSTQYAEEVMINGKKYIYIRVYTINDANAFILPGAKHLFEREAEPAGIEGMNMIVNAAKNRSSF